MYNYCQYVHVYDAGPFCGAESLQMTSLNFTDDEVTVVFYTAPGRGWRHDAELRAMFTVQDPGDDVIIHG